MTWEQTQDKILKVIKKYLKFILITAFIIAAGLVYLLFLIFNAVLDNSVFHENSAMAPTMALPVYDEGDSVATKHLSYRKTSSSISQSENYESNSNGGTDSEINYSDRKIIKNANISIIVKNIDDAAKIIIANTKKLNGFVQSSNFSREKTSYYYNNDNVRMNTKIKTGYLNLKVPSDNFDKIIGDIKKVAVEVENESQNAQDVTKRYFDLETQIKNKKLEEEQYRKLLEKSGSIKEILEVTKYLNSAKSERERLQGSLNYLKNQVQLSSITVNLKAQKDVEVFGVKWKPLYQLKLGFKNLLEDGKDLFNNTIIFLFKVPIYLVYIVVFILFIKIFKKVFRKIKNFINK